MPHPRIYMSPPHMCGRESAYVADAIASNWVAPVGPHLAKFEEDFARYIGVPHSVAVTTGTAALHLALRALELQPGDEVICSSFTFCASANPIRYEHANPVFVDSDWISWNIDPNLLEEELADCAKRGRIPKAIIAVDILGQSADIDAILQVASPYEIPVIEDAAEALGGSYKGRSVGSSCWCSIFSFNGNKIITTSGGGMLCSQDETLVEQARFLATQARDPVPHYEHSVIGYNYRLSNVLAAIGLAQLEVLDERVAARERNFRFYSERLSQLPGITLMPQAPYAQSNYWLSVIRIDEREFGNSVEDVRKALEKQNIESRRVWKPLHQQPAFATYRCRGGSVADQLFENGLCLPSGSSLTEGDLERICSGIESLA